MRKNVLTSFQAAKICSVSFMSINRWIESGKLNSFRTPGGHRRIVQKDLVQFIKKHDFPLSTLADLPPLKILIVDDEKESRDLIAEMLHSHSGNFNIQSADDGFDAGIKIAQFMPDVIILDLMMPKVDGFKVCTRIKSDNQTKHIQVIVLTGYGSDDNTKKAIKCGADRVLFKPLQFDVLIKEIEKVNERIML